MLTRRDLLRLVGGAAAAAAVPWPAAGCGDDLAPPAGGRFFDPHQWATIDLATGVVLPTDDAPGAREARAVRYIDGLLAAFDVAPPALFAGGPASGRQPYPDAHGAPTSRFPPDGFAGFLPVPRVRQIAWRMRIHGSAATIGGTFNDALRGPTRGWRDLYVAGVVALDAAADATHPGAAYVDLEPSEREAALYDAGGLEPDFLDALIHHTIEGTFAAPEYGGNDGLVGWTLARWDGDSVPFGHAFYDEGAGAYVDRADQPTSAPSPGDVTEDFSPDVIQLLTVSAIGSGGMRFF